MGMGMGMGLGGGGSLWGVWGERLVYSCRDVDVCTYSG